MLPLLTCLFEMNEDCPHTMDFLLSGSAFAAHADLLAFLPGVGRIIPLRPDETVRQSPPNVSVIPVRADHEKTSRAAATALSAWCSNSSTVTRRVASASPATPRFRIASPRSWVTRTFWSSTSAPSTLAKVGEPETSRREARPPGHQRRYHVPHQAEGERAGGSLKPLVLLSEWGEELGPYRRQLCAVVAERVGIPIRTSLARRGEAKLALWPGAARPVCSCCNTRVATVIAQKSEKRDRVPLRARRTLTTEGDLMPNSPPRPHRPQRLRRLPRRLGDRRRGHAQVRRPRHDRPRLGRHRRYRLPRPPCQVPRRRRQLPRHRPDLRRRPQRGGHRPRPAGLPRRLDRLHQGRPRRDQRPRLERFQQGQAPLADGREPRAAEDGPRGRLPPPRPQRRGHRARRLPRGHADHARGRQDALRRRLDRPQ